MAVTTSSSMKVKPFDQVRACAGAQRAHVRDTAISSGPLITLISLTCDRHLALAHFALALAHLRTRALAHFRYRTVTDAGLNWS